MVTAASLCALPYARVDNGTTPVKRDDAVLLLDDGSCVYLSSTLLDTGSSHFSFIDPDLVSTNPSLSSQCVDVSTTVRLGDNQTTVRLTKAIISNISFHVSGRLHKGSIQFFLFKSAYQVIIGLPDIILHFPSFMASQILHAAGLHEAAEVANLAAILPFPPSPTNAPIHQPWSSPLLSDAPEEIQEDEVVGAYLDKPYDEHVSAFYLSLPGRLGHREFAEHPDIVSALVRGGFLDVFVPTEWHGIYAAAAPNILPLELRTLPTLPTFLKLRSNDIPPKMREIFDKEFQRRRAYLYRPHSGPYASPVLATPKPPASDGTPQIRVATDYRAMNVHIEKNHEPLPNALATATSVSNFRYFFDLDARNGFHQIPLGPGSQNLLAIYTPTGQEAPLFLPEGVGPASHVFQKVMTHIFQEFILEGWCFVLIDNVALGANTIAEAVERFIRFLLKCRATGVVLKFEKSFYCQDVINFFGFEIGHGWVRMSDTRKRTLLELPFPTNLSSMKSFLGSANFFLPFVQNFNRFAAPLHDTTKKTFDWFDKAIIDKYRPDFDILKRECAESMELFTPDFTLEFLVRCDACLLGIGGALLMRLGPNHPKYPDQLVPLAFFSKKFSDVARRWTTIEQEGYAIFYAVCIAFRMFLYGKEFILETDHANLVYLEKSSVAKIIRWRMALQNYNFSVRHISGKRNNVADYLSRLYMIVPESLPICNDPQCLVSQQSLIPFCAPCPSLYVVSAPVADELQQAFDIVHSARSGHHGAERTYYLFMKKFPHVSIPFQLIADMVRACPWCQKLRAASNMSLRPFITHLELSIWPERGWVGCDVLTLAMTTNGNNKLVVFVVHDTKLCDLYPVKNEEAITIARCAYIFIMTYGRYRGFSTDPGSCFTSHVIAFLNKWFGFGHKVSLVDRHQSCGAEGTNRSVVRHIKALTMCESACKIWDEPEYVTTVKNIVNSTADTENGASPHELTFGSESLRYFEIPEPLDSNEGMPASDRTRYLENLNNNLRTIHQEKEQYHRRVLEERARDNPLASEQRTFCEGDLVMPLVNPRSRIHKLTPSWLGPYRVVSQVSSDVQCRQIATGFQTKFHVSQLILYTGADDETAFQLACRDDEQHKVRGIRAYRGEPVTGRKYCTFLVEFSDGELCWIQYGPDLCRTEVFGEYCAKTPELRILLMPILRAVEMLKTERVLSIPQSFTTGTWFLDLRIFSFTWYDSLQLPESDTKTYVIEAVFHKYTNVRKTRAEMFVPLFKEFLRNLDFYWFRVNVYRALEHCTAESIVIVDGALISQYPHILDSSVIPARSPSEEFPPLQAGTTANRLGRYSNHVSNQEQIKSNVAIPRSQPRARGDRNTSFDNHEPTAELQTEIIAPVKEIRRSSRLHKTETSAEPEK